MDSLFDFGVELNLASSSRSSVATEISSSLNLITFVLPGDGFLLDGERGVGDDDDDAAALAAPPLGFRLEATTRAGEAKGAAPAAAAAAAGFT